MIKSRMLRWVFLLSVFLLTSHPLEGAPQSSITLNFKPQIAVQGGTIYLEDIATIHGSPLSLVEKVGRLRIENSPLPGETSILSRAFLASRIGRSEFSALLAEAGIPDQIEVTRLGRVLGQAELARIVEDGLQRALEDKRKTIKVKEIQVSEKIIAPPGDLSWEVKAPDRFYQGGNLSLSLIPQVDGQKVHEYRLQAQLEIYADVVIARSYLTRHQVVSEKDVQLTHKNITLYLPDVLMDLEEVLGRRMTLAVSAQEVLRKSMVEVPPLVKKGERVILLIENPSFKITTLGETQEEGREGERIKVVNISSKKETYGRVLDAQTVQIDF
jgi:flagellar basal body P-ring formation protein FlgA